MNDKMLALVLSIVALGYNAVVGGPPPISPELIFVSAFSYLTGSAVGYAKGKNGNGTG